MGARESVVHRAILKDLRERGGVWIKVHGSAQQGAGISDIIGCIHGRFVAFEVKRIDGNHKLSPRQKYFLEKVANAGGISAVIYTPDEAIEILEHHGL